MAQLQVNYRSHNEIVLRNLEEGDLIEFPRGMFSHWGVYVGDEQVVHLTKTDNDINAIASSTDLFTIGGQQCVDACVSLDNFWDVAHECKAKKNNDKDRMCQPQSSEEIKRRAFSQLGRKSYSALWRNCEHFAAWCRNDINFSEQAVSALSTIILGGAALVLGLGAIALFGGRRQRD